LQFIVWLTLIYFMGSLSVNESARFAGIPAPLQLYPLGRRWQSMALFLGMGYSLGKRYELRVNRTGLR
jgi:hypothetical protein